MDLSLVEVRAGERVYACRFTPEDTCFHEHFPGNPVLPGSMVAALSLQAVREDFGRTGTLRVERFAFRRFAAPGAYELRITASDDDFRCQLIRDTIVHAEGRITCI